MKLQKNWFMILSASFACSNTHAQTIAFEQLWGKVKEVSPAISREGHEARAADFASSRARLNWLPSFSLGASAFSTNDPGNNFFSNLSQRRVSSLDFSPTTLNEPGSHVFENLSLGLDLPLYEGGRRIAEADVLAKVAEVHRLNRASVSLNEYVESALMYAQLGALSQASERLKILSDRVSVILSHYSIGSESNPVGYSGMLGLKSLKNRIEGELLSVDSKAALNRQSLSEKAKLGDQPWTVKSEETLSFLSRVMPVLSEGKTSYPERQAQLQSEVMDGMKQAEKSRFLPRIGLFANEGITHGDRDTGSSFTGGLYLQWSIFNPDHLHRVDEKNEIRLAAVSGADAARQAGDIGRKALIQNEESMKKSLALLLDSEKLLSEQVRVASRLFQSGAVSALQLSEVLNRRADLILSLLTVEQGLIEVRGKRLNLTQADGVAL